MVCKQFTKFAQGPWYWLMFILAGTGLLAVALFYQYRLEEQPCVLCIHVRLWVALLVIVSVAGLLSHKIRLVNSLCQLALVLISAALLERAYQILGGERGFIEGECGFDTGLPVWFDVQNWVPWLFRIETTCGYTPVIMFGITMSESLLFISAMFLLITLAGLWASFIRK